MKKINNPFKEKAFRNTFAIFLLVVVMFLLGLYIYIIPALIGLYLGNKLWNRKNTHQQTPNS